MSSKSTTSPKKGIVTSPKANEMVLTRQKSAQFKRQLRNKDRSMKRITQLLKSPTSKTHQANIKHSKTVKKIPPKCVTKPVKELIESDKMSPIVKINKVLINVEPEVNKVTESKANVQPCAMCPIKKDAIEQKNEYYPNNTRRKVKVKKIMLKPNCQMKVIGDIKSINKRKMGIPKKDLPLSFTRQTRILASSPKPLLNEHEKVTELVSDKSYAYSDRNMNEVLQIMEKDLTDEDLMEIFTCPSPVWWEDPTDSEFEEDAIEIKKEATSEVSEIYKNRLPQKQFIEPHKAEFKGAFVNQLESKQKSQKPFSSNAGVVDNAICIESVSKENVKYKSQHLNNKAGVVNPVCNVSAGKDNIEYKIHKHLDNQFDKVHCPVYIKEKMNYETRNRLDYEAGDIYNPASDECTRKRNIDYGTQKRVDNKAGDICNTVSDLSTKKENMECEFQQLHNNNINVVNTSVCNISTGNAKAEYESQQNLNNEAGVLDNSVVSTVSTRVKDKNNKSLNGLKNYVSVTDNLTCNLSTSKDDDVDIETICRIKECPENCNMDDSKVINNISKVHTKQNIEFLKKRRKLETILGCVKSRLIISKTDITNTHNKSNVVHDVHYNDAVRVSYNQAKNHNKQCGQVLRCPKNIVFSINSHYNFIDMAKNLNLEPSKNKNSHSCKTNLNVNEKLANLQTGTDQSQKLENRVYHSEFNHNSKKDYVTIIDDNLKCSRNNEPRPLKSRPTLKSNLNNFFMKDLGTTEHSFNTSKSLLVRTNYSLDSNIKQNKSISKIEAVTKNIWETRNGLERNSGCDRNKIIPKINKIYIHNNRIGRNEILSNIKESRTDNNLKTPKQNEALLDNSENLFKKLSSKYKQNQKISENALSNHEKIFHISNHIKKPDNKNNVSNCLSNITSDILASSTSNDGNVKIIENKVLNFGKYCIEQSSTKFSRQKSSSESTDGEEFAYDDEMLMQLENIDIPVENTEDSDLQKKENISKYIVVDDNNSQHTPCNYLSNMFSYSNRYCVSNFNDIQSEQKYKKIKQNNKEEPLSYMKHNFTEKFVSLIKSAKDQVPETLPDIEKTHIKLIDKEKIMSPDSLNAKVDFLSIKPSHSLLDAISNKNTSFVIDEKVAKTDANSSHSEQMVSEVNIHTASKEESINNSLYNEKGTKTQEISLKTIDNEDLVMTKKKEGTVEDLEYITVYKIISNTDKTECLDKKMQYTQPKSIAIEKNPDKQIVTVVSYREELNIKRDNEKIDVTPKVCSYMNTKKRRNVNKKMRNETDSVTRKIKANGKVQRNLDVSQSIFSTSIVKNTLLENDEKSIICKQKKIKRQLAYRQLKKRDRIVVSQDTRVKYCMKCSSIFDTEFCTYCKKI